MHHSLVSIWTNARSLIVFGAIIIGAVIKCAVSTSHWPSTSLVHEMPMKTGEWTMLCAFVLQEERALLDAKLFQISRKQHQIWAQNRENRRRKHWRMRRDASHQLKIHLRVMIWLFRLSCQQRFRLWRHFVITEVRGGFAQGTLPIRESKALIWITCMSGFNNFSRFKDIYVLVNPTKHLTFSISRMVTSLMTDGSLFTWIYTFLWKEIISYYQWLRFITYLLNSFISIFLT